MATGDCIYTTNEGRRFARRDSESYELTQQEVRAFAFLNSPSQLLQLGGWPPVDLLLGMTDAGRYDPRWAMGATPLLVAALVSEVGASVMQPKLLETVERATREGHPEPAAAIVLGIGLAQRQYEHPELAEHSSFWRDVAVSVAPMVGTTYAVALNQALSDSAWPQPRVAPCPHRSGGESQSEECRSPTREKGGVPRVRASVAGLGAERLDCCCCGWANEVVTLPLRGFPPTLLYRCDQARRHISRAADAMLKRCGGGAQPLRDRLTGHVQALGDLIDAGARTRGLRQRRLAAPDSAAAAVSSRERPQPHGQTAGRCACNRCSELGRKGLSLCDD